MKPLVSVIVPVYKVEPYIAACAESLFTQTWPALEFIFVNDATPDRSMEVLEALIDSRFAALRPRIVRIDKRVNEGLPQARRTGVERARGEWILHVDSDDFLERDAVERLLAAVQDDTDVVYFHIRKEWSGGRRRISRDARYASGAEYARDIVHFRAHGFLWNKLMRRRLYERELFYPRYNMHEDIVLSCQLLQGARGVVRLPEPLYHYRRDNPAAVTRERKAARRLQSARNFLDLYEYWHGREDSPIAALEPDLLLRPAWIAWRMAPELFVERPYLKAAVKALPLRIPASLKGFRQLLLKGWLRFRG